MEQAAWRDAPASSKITSGPALGLFDVKDRARAKEVRRRIAEYMGKLKQACPRDISTAAYSVSSCQSRGDPWSASDPASKHLLRSQRLHEKPRGGLRP